VSSIEWPDLTDSEYQLLIHLRVWDEAVNTEHETALLVRAMAGYETDPVMAGAISLQAFEEERHAALVAGLKPFDTERHEFSCGDEDPARQPDQT
jgi:hypothetical protein